MWRPFGYESKQHAVNLVSYQGYSFETAAEAVRARLISFVVGTKISCAFPEPCGDEASIKVKCLAKTDPVVINV